MLTPIPANCPLCGAPTKNEICPSCGWNPAAPNPGLSEAQLADQAKARELRRLMGLPDPAPAPVAVAPAAAPAPGDPGDDVLRGYLLGLGYQAAAVPSLLQNNRAGIVESFNRAHVQTSAPAAQTSNAAAQTSIPQNSAPPAGAGW